MERISSPLSRIFFWALATAAVFLAVFIFLQVQPFYKSFAQKEEDLFYGKVTSVAIPRGLNGSGIPLFDRLYFHLNEDKKASFLLSLSPKQNESFKPVLEFWALTEMPDPVGVRGRRISDWEWVVTEISGKDWGLDAAETRDFHLRSMVWYSILEIALMAFALFAIRKSSRRKR